MPEELQAANSNNAQNQQSTGGDQIAMSE